MKFDIKPAVLQFLIYAQNILKLPEEEEKQVDKLIEKKDSLAKLLKSYSHEEEEHKDDVKEFLNHIRNKHHEAEDMIDNHKSTMICQCWKSRGKKFAHYFISGPYYLEKLICLDKKLEEILTNQSMIERITTSQTRFKKVSSWPWEESNYMVGFKQEEDMVMLLTQGKVKLDIISIVGMGGIGKSALARKIFYNNSKVIDHFECLVWVNATRNFKKSEFLCSTLDYLCGEEKFAELDIIKKDEKKLKETISNYLRSKRYLIVIDDVWFGRDVWIEIRKVFPDNNNQSRILLTSRSSGIGRPFNLPFLNLDESWLLLSQKALGGSETQEDKFGKLIASKCGGLPASIMVMAGILADEDRDLWWKVDERIKDYLYDQEKQPLEIIFSSSYNDLPHYLKQCFLYLIAFPEDTDIPARKLIRLWTSEELITEIKDGKSIEQIADEYMYELYRRSLIQVTKWRTDKGIKQIRIHSVLRELCIINSTKEKFLHLHRYPHSPFPVDSLRRLAIYDLSTITNIQTSTPSFNSYSVLHSILCFDKHYSNHRSLNPIPILSSLSYKYFKYLRVLDIGFVVVTQVPKELGSLRLLRYIRINAPSAKLLPESITKLSHLQTLDARNSRIDKLPDGIWEMRSLRHLFLGGCDNIPKPKNENSWSSLGNLQSLSIINYHGKSYRNFFDSIPNLIKLGIHGTGFSKIPGSSTLPSANHIMSIPHLPHLLSLKVVSYSVFPKFRNDTLKKITVLETTLSSYDMLNLGKLPNLQILKLRKVKFETRSMICEAGTFHELQVLHLLEMEILQWKLVKDAMANLSTVVIDKPYPNLVESFRCINSQSGIKLVMKNRNLQEGNAFGENHKNNQTGVSSSRLYKLCKVIREA